MAVIVAVIAGSTYEIGTLDGIPQVGEANWTAWRTLDVPAGGGPPTKILTEDSTNFSQGPDGGYVDSAFGPIWLLIVQNFYTVSHNDEINLVFGGLGPVWSGTIWQYDFNWDQLTDTYTFHDPISQSTTLSGACPMLTGGDYVNSPDDMVIIGDPYTTYYIYRTQNAGCEGCTNSNGIYLYLATIVTDASGVATYNDNTTLESWYVAVRAGDGVTALGGCHSEEINPTAVVISNFEAIYNYMEPSVSVSWETISELGLISFDLLRSEFGSTQREFVANIQAESPGQLSGHTYLYIDESIEVGKEYSYWLALVGPNHQVVGPASVFTGYRLHLPFLQK